MHRKRKKGRKKKKSWEERTEHGTPGTLIEILWLLCKMSSFIDHFQSRLQLLYIPSYSHPTHIVSIYFVHLSHNNIHSLAADGRQQRGKVFELLRFTGENFQSWATLWHWARNFMKYVETKAARKRDEEKKGGKKNDVDNTAQQPSNSLSNDYISTNYFPEIALESVLERGTLMTSPDEYLPVRLFIFRKVLSSSFDNFVSLIPAIHFTWDVTFSALIFFDNRQRSHRPSLKFHSFPVAH